MLIKDALVFATKELKNFPSKQLEARIILTYTLSITQEALVINYDKKITEDEKSRFFEYIRRRKLFEPIAYILKQKEFYGINFYVDKNVLIPRADTETLVDKMLLEYNKYFFDRGIKILDLGTGSGAIATSLASCIPLSKIIATDICPKSLKIATNNAQLNKVSAQIKFIESDWYLKLKDKKFNFIVSNPPYISSADKKYMSQETVLYEPQKALFAKGNGLIHYNKIISDARFFLKARGKIFIEIGFNQSKDVSKIFKKYEFNEIIIFKDLSGHDRVIVATSTYL